MARITVARRTVATPIRQVMVISVSVSSCISSCNGGLSALEDCGFMEDAFYAFHDCFALTIARSIAFHANIRHDHISQKVHVCDVFPIHVEDKISYKVFLCHLPINLSFLFILSKNSVFS